MKKTLVLKVLLIVTVIFQVVVGSQSFAENNTPSLNGDSKVGVSIGEVKQKEVKPGVYKPEVDPTVRRLLPQTNEIINTLLLILFALCVFMLLIGIFMFKRIYENNNYIFV